MSAVADTDNLAFLGRSAMLRGFRQQAEALGLNAFALATEVGLDPAVLANPDLHVPVRAMVEMFELAAERGRSPEFALRVVAQRKISNLGLIALLAREEPTLRQALRSLQRYLWLQNEGLDMIFEEVDGGVLLQGQAYVPMRRQAVDLYVGMLLVFVRELIGEQWRPREIYLPYPAPERLEPYGEVFKIRPRFGYDQPGVLIDAEDLDTRLPNADPDIVSQLRRQLETATRTRKTGFVAGVRSLIETRLASGDHEIGRIAALLGLSARSFQRRLAEHGVTYSQLLEETRRSSVAVLLAERERSIERVSYLLGFATPSSFNQWFKQRFGCTPSAFRARDLTS